MSPCAMWQNIELTRNCNQEADRFSLHSDRYSPSFYHFKPNKTVLHHSNHNNNGSIYKEAIPPDHAPFYRQPPPAAATPAGGAAPAGNSYTGMYNAPP